MDDINAFFNLSKDFKRENLPATHINTRLLPGPSNFVQPKFVGTEYGDEYRKAELEKVGPGFIITKNGPMYFAKVYFTKENRILNTFC